MYIPLLAGFFAPFSLVDPNLSLFLWQLMSVVALALSVTILSRVSRIKISELFFLSFLYGPVFLTLWAGQLGLGFGLLPLCIGYFLLLRQMPFAAGIVWSFLLLKPQYFFAPAFVALVNALTGRYRTLTGMSVGVVCLIVLTTAAFSTPLTVQWLLSHRVSDAYFFSGLQGIPSHLLTGLPANLLILFSVNERELVKLPLYAGAAAMWLFGFWFCSRFKKLQMAESAQISVTFVVGLVLSSLTLPHLLYYDLCILLPAGVLLLARDGPFAGADYRDRDRRRRIRRRAGHSRRRPREYSREQFLFRDLAGRLRGHYVARLVQGGNSGGRPENYGHRLEGTGHHR